MSSYTVYKLLFRSERLVYVGFSSKDIVSMAREHLPSVIKNKEVLKLYKENYNFAVIKLETGLTRSEALDDIQWQIQRLKSYGYGVLNSRTYSNPKAAEYRSYIPSAKQEPPLSPDEPKKRCSVCRSEKYISNFRSKQAHCKFCKIIFLTPPQLRYKCTSCKKTLHVTKFNKNRNRPSGYDNTCRACRKAYDKERYAKAKRS